MDQNNECCGICDSELTIKNVVNIKCGHQQCCDCFWKWAETSNACPFCRADMIPRDRGKELEVKNMCDRRLEILGELDELYTEDLELRKRMKYDRILVIILEKRKKELTCQIYMKNNIAQRIVEWEKAPERTMNKWKQEQERFKTLTISRDKIIENNAIRLKMNDCMDEYASLKKVTRGTSKKYGQRPILNFNTNPIPMLWVPMGPHVRQVIIPSALSLLRSQDSMDSLYTITR